MAPKPIDTQDTNTFMPGSAWSPQLVAQLMHQGPVSENFSTCKSGIQYGTRLLCGMVHWCCNTDWCCKFYCITAVL